MPKSYMDYTRTFYWNFKKFGLTLSDSEIKQGIITVLIIAFILSFRQWGGETFSWVDGAMNFAIAAVFSAIALVASQLGQRWIAVHYGYNPEYKMSAAGMMISAVIAFASRGTIIFFMPGYTIIHHLAASRLGEFRYYTNLWEWSKVCFGGPLMNFLLAALLSAFPHPAGSLMHRLIIVNIWFAIFQILPLPFNPGMYMFFYYRWFWAFATGMIISGCVLLLVSKIWIAIVAGSLIGLMSMAYLFLKKDNALKYP